MHYIKTKNWETEEKDKWKANFTVEISPLAYMGTSLISLTSFNNINGFFNLERFYIIAICISILDINQSISSCTVYFTKSSSVYFVFLMLWTIFYKYLFILFSEDNGLLYNILCLTGCLLHCNAVDIFPNTQKPGWRWSRANMAKLKWNHWRKSR